MFEDGQCGFVLDGHDLGTAELHQKLRDVQMYQEQTCKDGGWPYLLQEQTRKDADLSTPDLLIPEAHAVPLPMQFRPIATNVIKEEVPPPPVSAQEWNRVINVVERNAMRLLAHADNECGITVGSLGHPHYCAPACKYVKKKSGCREGAACTQ